MKNTEVQSEKPMSLPANKSKPKPLRTVSGLDKPTVVVAQPPIEVANPVVQEPVKPVNKRTKPVKAKPVAKTLPVQEKTAKVEAPRLTVAEQIWNSIKDRELGLFGLTGQTVAKYCTPLFADPNRCMLKYKVSSVIPALEAAVPDYDFDVMDIYLLVSKKK